MIDLESINQSLDEDLNVVEYWMAFGVNVSEDGSETCLASALYASSKWSKMHLYKTKELVMTEIARYLNIPFEATYRDPENKKYNPCSVIENLDEKSEKKFFDFFLSNGFDLGERGCSKTFKSKTELCDFIEKICNL